MLRWEEVQARRDAGIALVIQILLNVHRDPQQPQPPTAWADVMAWLGHRMPAPAPPPVLTPEALEAQVEALHALYSQRQGTNGTMDG